jgi:hypothetical protein
MASCGGEQQRAVSSCVQEEVTSCVVQEKWWLGFRVWHTWANWAKKGAGPYLNTPHTYGYSYPVTQVSEF